MRAGGGGSNEQPRVAACPDLVQGSGRVTNPIAQAVPTPALRKVREGRSTHLAADGRKIKSLGPSAHET
jgi:hypothetical protein